MNTIWIITLVLLIVEVSFAYILKSVIGAKIGQVGCLILIFLAGMKLDLQLLGILLIVWIASLLAKKRLSDLKQNTN